MSKVSLRDYEKWKLLNKDIIFSYYDYLYQVVNSSQISSDFYFASLELFWPKFIVIDSYVFLEQNFSKQKFNELLNLNKNVEFWMNLLVIDPFFERDEDLDPKAKLFAKRLSEIWTAKLKIDFPNKEIKVDCLFDSDVGDYGLTFYQGSLPR